MPLWYAGIKSGGMQGFEAWRWDFFIPGGMFLIMAALVLLYSEDSPLGDYRDMKKKGQMAKGQAWKVFKIGISNYRLV